MTLVAGLSGIRGVYDDGLDIPIAQRYAAAYFSFMKGKFGPELKIVVGRDTRPSGHVLHDAIFEVLDCEVIDVGVASTPAVEFGVREYGAHGGIIITASHNEPYWNGFKFLGSDGAVLSAEDMGTVLQIFETITPEIAIKNKTVVNKEKELEKDYIGYALSFLSKSDVEKIKKSELKIILDVNGGTGSIAAAILKELGIKVVEKGMEPGIFSRKVEPNVDSLIYLKNELKETNADLAAGFDCDADRVEIVTAKRFVTGNHLLALAADSILKEAENKKIVVNDATSGMVKVIADKYKAEYVEVGVGETNVVSRMYEIGAALGGEGSSSGVIIPPSRCRDGMVTLLLIINVIVKNNKNLDELLGALPTSFYLKEKIETDTSNLDKIKKKLVAYYSDKKGIVYDNFPEGSFKFSVEGLSFAWFRASKTEVDVLRVIVDAPSQEEADALIKEAMGVLK